MNTVEDRANRIAAVRLRSRDLFWIFSLTTATHLIVLVIMSLGYSAANVPITIWIVFVTIIGIMASLDCMDDIKAIGMDRGDDEVNTHFQKRFENVRWGAFKGLTVAGLSLTALAEIYVMYAKLFESAGLT